MKIKSLFTAMVLLLLVVNANAFEVVSSFDFPDEAFRSFSYTLEVDETIDSIGWMVTDAGDDVIESRLFIANIIIGSSFTLDDIMINSNGDFETGSFWGHSGSTGTVMEFPDLGLTGGDTISFDWSFSSDELSSAAFEGFNDFSLARVGGTVYELGIVAAVPEMETWAMLVFGVGLVGRMARRKRKTM